MPLSTCWQNPCVVAIVAASKSASGGGDAGVPPDQFVGRHGGEEREHLVGGRRRDAVHRGLQPGLGGDEALADARAQLAGGHPPERHEQHAVERRALGDVPGGEGGDRERLAGAGARLEQGDAGRAAGRTRRTGSVPSQSRPLLDRRAARPTAGAA